MTMHEMPEMTRRIQQSVIDAFADPVITFSVEGNVIGWNSAAEHYYHYMADAAMGQNVGALPLQETVKSFLRDGLQLKQTLTDTLHSVLRITSNNGRKGQLEVRLVPIKNELGELIAAGFYSKDVSAYRAMAKDAAQSLNRFRTITDVVPQIIWENDKNGKANYFNQQFFNYSGCTFEELLGFGWEVIAHEEDKEATHKWRIALMTLEIFEAEVRLRRADGKFEWHLVRNVPLKDDKGNVLSWFGSATNVQRLKEMQFNLIEATERLRTTLETAKDFAIITTDKDGIIIDWNSGAENILGYSREEAIGRNAEMIFTPEDKYGNIPLLEFKTALETGRSIDERWHLHKDGSRFFMSGVMAPIRHTSMGGFVKVARNITDRKLAEEALFLSEQRKSLLMQTAQMGEWEWNIAADKVQWNEKACRLLGITHESEADKLQSFFSFIYPGDLAMVKEQFRATLTGLNVFQAEFRIERADNQQVHWMNGYGRVIAFDEDRPLRMIGVLYDITDRKMSEKQKDDFINVASHELKTPVTSIKAYSDVLQDIFTESNQTENAGLVKSLNTQVDRLVKLIYNLLDATSVSAGYLKLQPEKFDLNELINEQVKEFSVLSRHPIRWQPAQIPLIHADRDRIRQVMTNFVSNAIKYSPDGSDIVVSIRDNSDSVIFRVRDFGMGISPDEQGKIFQRYVRASDDKISSYPGLGLGLYISSEIIKQHHGTIGVESVPGKGSTFYFTLPYS